jgi:16S rRNA (uracil1498-N3)-methyltransferase
MTSSSKKSSPHRMNLILFEADEVTQPLSRKDPRAHHILTVLRRNPGESFDVGLVNGPQGKGVVAAQAASSLMLTFAWGAEPPPLDPITLIIGLPRPQTARDILRDATTLGVAAIHFVLTEKSEPTYAQSTLWSSGEWRRHLLAGAAQAFDTRLPDVTHGIPVCATLDQLPARLTRLALDNYEAPLPLSHCHLSDDNGIALALGPERGWSAVDRDLLRGAGFTLAHLGPRVLRTEAACTAALAVLKARRGLF